MTEGDSRTNAEVMALKELGDPKAAARRFRKKHLTEKESKKVSELITEATGPYSRSQRLADLSGHRRLNFRHPVGAKYCFKK